MDTDEPERDRIHDALASHATDYAVRETLHDVPPYRVYEVEVDGRRAVLKLDAHPRGHAAAEGRVQAHVADHTAVPAPPVLAVGRDHFLAAWDENAPTAGAGTVDEAWARAAGACMARLHAETAGAFDAYGRPVDRDGLAVAGHDAWIDAVRARLAYHREYLVDLGYAGVVDRVDAFFGEHPDAFAGAGAPVLCHGNVHPEHAAVAGGEVVSLIDFEHALLAPGEYDYWRLALPQFEGADGRSDAERAFRAGYESVRPLSEGFEHRKRAYALLNFVAYFESLYLQRNAGPAERAERAERMTELVDETLAALRADLA
jgi:Ser/Thr protein kinase RdoA (MazF antagonist)